MKLLVTGCEGSIGRHLVRRLERENHQLRGFDMVDASSADIEYVRGDLRDEAAVRNAVRGMDAVFHLGAIQADRKGREGEVLTVNVQGTWNVLLACVGEDVERAVCFSSINSLGCVLGYRPAAYLPIDDAYPRHPMTAYQLSKHLIEETCRTFSQRYGLITPCLRPVWVSDPQVSARWDTWRREERMDEEMRHQYWVYADSRDMDDAAVRALTAPLEGHDAFLIAAADSITHTPTAELVERYFPDTPWRVDRDEYLAGASYRSLVDCSHARNELGWQPHHTWRETSPSAPTL